MTLMVFMMKSWITFGIFLPTSIALTVALYIAWFRRLGKTKEPSLVPSRGEAPLEEAQAEMKEQMRAENEDFDARTFRDVRFDGGEVDGGGMTVEDKNSAIIADFPTRTEEEQEEENLELVSSDFAKKYHSPDLDIKPQRRHHDHHHHRNNNDNDNNNNNNDNDNNN